MPTDTLPPRRRRHEPVAGPRAALRYLAGGLNRAGLVTLPQGQYDELRIELRVSQDETCQLVGELLPVARRLEFLARAEGSPRAWNLAAGMVDRLSRFARRCEPRPAA